jgi:hypothetical protein
MWAMEYDEFNNPSILKGLPADSKRPQGGLDPPLSVCRPICLSPLEPLDGENPYTMGQWPVQGVPCGR